MMQWIKEVGRGKRGAKDLSYEAALEAAEMIRTRQATPAQIGAFFMAERIKTESMDEILAFVDCYRNSATLYPLPNSLDCAGPYDGRRASFFTTLPTAFVLAACDVPVTLHGSSSLPPKWGITLIDLMELMEIPLDPASRPMQLHAAQQSGFLFVPTEAWHPDLQAIRSIRLELGVRTVLNTVEKLLRFSDAPYMAIGVYHGTVFEKVAQLLIRLGVKKGIVVQGMEGSEDVSVQKPTRALIVEDGHHEPFLIDPANYGLQSDIPEIEWTPRLQLDTAYAVLQGEAELPYRNMVLFNSGLRLWITGACPSIEAGIERARHALDQGLAWERFQTWKHHVQVAHNPS